MQTGMPTTCPASSQSSPNVAAVTSTSITAAAGTEDGNSKTQSANAMLAKAAVPNKSSKIYRPPHLREHQPSTLPARAGTEEGAKEGLVLTQKKTESEVVQHVNEEGKSITTSMTGAAAIVTSSSTEVTTTLTRPQGSTPGSSSGAVPYFPSRPEITSLATAAANTPTAANATSYNSNTNSKNTTMGNTMPAGVGLMSVHHNMPTEYRPASYARSHNASISSGVATPACSPHSLQGGAGGGSNSSGNNTAFVTSALESQPMPYLQSNITTTGGSSTSPLSTGPGQRARVMSMSGLPTQQQYNSNSAQLPNSNSSYHHQSNTTITNNSTSSSSASPGLHLSMPNNNTTMMMATTATNSSSNGGTMSNTLPLLTTSTNSGNNTMGNMAMNGLAGPAWQAPFMYPMAGPQTLLPPPPPPPPPPPLPCYSFIHVLPAYVDACLTCTEKDRQLREQLFDKVQAIARQALNASAEVRVHGSVMTGLALPSSDIDFLVTNYQPLAPLDAIQQLSSALLRTDATSLAEARHLAYDEAHNTENNEENEAHLTSNSKEEQREEGDEATEKRVATESTTPNAEMDSHTVTSTVVTDALATPSSSSPTTAANNKLNITHSTGTSTEKVKPTSSHGQDLAALNEVTSAIDAELHELTKDHIAPVLPHTHHHHIHHDDDDSDAYKTREDIECAEELYRNQIEKDYSFSTPCELSPLFAAVLARQQQQQSSNSGRMSSSPRVAALLTDSHDETHHTLHEVTDITQKKIITGSHNGEGSAREDPLTLTSPNAHHHHHHHTHNNANTVIQHRSEFDTCCSSLSCSFPATGSALLVATGAFTSLPVGSTSPAVEKLMNEPEKTNMLAGDEHDVSDEKENQPVITATSTRDTENVARTSKGEKAAVDATLTTKDEDKQEATTENNTSTTATVSLLVPHSDPVSTLTSAVMMPMAPMNNSQPVVVDPLLAPVLPFHAGPTLLPPRQVMMMMMRPAVTTSTNISTAANVTSSGPSFGPSQSSMMPSYLSYVPTLEGPLFLVQTIISTRVPVIKVTEKATGLRADITFAGGEHWRSMQLTRQLLTVFPHARRLILFLKHCVRALGIGDSEPGGVSSFTIYLMVRHFFNACRERIIALLEKQMAQQQQQEQKAAAGSTESSLASSSSSSSSSSSAAEVTSSGSTGPQQDSAAQHQSEAGPSASPNAGDINAKEAGRTSSPTHSHTASSSQPVQQQLQTSSGGTSTAASQVPKVTTTNVTPEETKANMPTSSNYMNVGSANTMPPQTQPPPPHYQPLSMALLEHLVRAYLLRVERQRVLQQTRAKDTEASSTPASNSNASEATPSPTGLALVRKELRTVEESILAFLGAGSSTGSSDLDLTSSAETHEMLCEGGNATGEHVDELRRGLRLSGVEEDTILVKKKKTSDGSESTSRSSPVGVLREVEPTASTSASSTARLTASASTAEMSEAVAAESKKSEANDKPITNNNNEGEGSTSEEQRRVLRNFAEDFLRHRVTLSQVFCDFCHYYGCAFNYETEGIHFDLNGDSTVVPKPYLCARRGQYFHLTSPFDPEYDLTARMTCMREFQWLCWWFATNATLGPPELNGNDEATTPPMAMPTGCSLQYIAQWLSPMTAEADVMAVHYKLLEQYHHECAAALTAASLRGHPFELYEPSVSANGAMTTTPMMMNNNTTTSIPMMGPGWPTMNGLPASPQMTMMTASPPQARGTVVVGGGGMAYNGFYPGFAPAVMNPQPWQNNMQPAQPIVGATSAAPMMMTTAAMQGFVPTRQPLLPNGNIPNTPIMASGMTQPTLTAPQPTVTLGGAPLLNTSAPLVNTPAMASQAAAPLVPQDESNTNTNNNSSNKAVSTTGSVQAERVSMEDTTRAHNSNNNIAVQAPVSTATCGRSMPAPVAIDHVASPHRGEKRGEVVAHARQGTEPSEQSGMPRQEPAASEFTRATTNPIVMPLLQLPTQGEAVRVRVNSSSGSSSKGRSGGATSAPVQTATKEDVLRSSEEAKKKRESSTPKVHERSPEVGNALRQGPERLMYALHTIDSNSTSNASMTDTMTYYNTVEDGAVDENSVANSPEKRGRKGGASRNEQRGRHNRVLTLTNTALAPHRDNGEVSPRMRSNSLNGVATDALQQNEGDTKHNTRAGMSPQRVSSHDNGQKGTAEGEGMHTGAEQEHDANNNPTTTTSNANGDNNNSSGRSARPKHQPGLYGPEGTTAAFFYDSRRRHTMIDGSSSSGWGGNNSNKLQRPSALGLPVPALADNTSADPTHPRTNSSMTASTDNPNAAAGVANMYPNSPHNNNTTTTSGATYYGMPSNGYMNRPNMPPPPLPQQQQQSNGPRFMNTAERVNQMRPMMNNNNGYYYHSNNSSPTMPYGAANPNAGPARNNNGNNAPMNNGYGNRPAMAPAMPGYGNTMNEPSNNNMMPCGGGGMMMNNNGGSNNMYMPSGPQLQYMTPAGQQQQQQQQGPYMQPGNRPMQPQQQQGPYMPYGNYVQPPAMWGPMPSPQQQQQQQQQVMMQPMGPGPMPSYNNNNNRNEPYMNNGRNGPRMAHSHMGSPMTPSQPQPMYGVGGGCMPYDPQAAQPMSPQQQQQQQPYMMNNGGGGYYGNYNNNSNGGNNYPAANMQPNYAMPMGGNPRYMPMPPDAAMMNNMPCGPMYPDPQMPPPMQPCPQNMNNANGYYNNNNNNSNMGCCGPAPMPLTPLNYPPNGNARTSNNNNGGGQGNAYYYNNNNGSPGYYSYGNNNNNSAMMPGSPYEGMSGSGGYANAGNAMGYNTAPAAAAANDTSATRDETAVALSTRHALDPVLPVDVQPRSSGDEGEEQHVIDYSSSSHTVCKPPIALSTTPAEDALQVPQQQQHQHEQSNESSEASRQHEIAPPPPLDNDPCEVKESARCSAEQGSDAYSKRPRKWQAAVRLRSCPPILPHSMGQHAGQHSPKRATITSAAAAAIPAHTRSASALSQESLEAPLQKTAQESSYHVRQPSHALSTTSSHSVMYHAVHPSVSTPHMSTTTTTSGVVERTTRSSGMYPSNYSKQGTA